MRRYHLGLSQMFVVLSAKALKLRDSRWRHLLVDGYNLVGGAGMAGPSGSGRLEAARDALVRDLAGYRRRKGHADYRHLRRVARRPGAEHRRSSSRAWRSCIPSGANAPIRWFNGSRVCMAGIARWCPRIMKWPMQQGPPGVRYWTPEFRAKLHERPSRAAALAFRWIGVRPKW